MDNESDEQIGTENEESDLFAKKNVIVADVHKINEDQPETFSGRSLVISMSSDSEKRQGGENEEYDSEEKENDIVSDVNDNNKDQPETFP